MVLPLYMCEQEILQEFASLPDICREVILLFTTSEDENLSLFNGMYKLSVRKFYMFRLL